MERKSVSSDSSHYCSHRVLGALHQRVFPFACVIVQSFRVLFSSTLYIYTLAPFPSPLSFPALASLSFKSVPLSLSLNYLVSPSHNLLNLV